MAIVLIVLVVAAILAVLFGAVRWQGQHHPHPMPYWLEGFFLDNPLRRLVFGPGLVLDLARLRPGERAAEVGSGIGYIAAALSGAVGSSGRVWALDQSPAAVEATQARLSTMPAPADVSLGDATRLPWESDSLDTVVMVAMLGELAVHLRPAVLAEANRVVKPGGRVVVVEYWPDPHFLSRPTLLGYLDAAGLEVEATRTGVLQHGVRATPRDRRG